MDRLNAVPLFENLYLDAPKTEGIKYAGSKLKFLSYILELAEKTKAKTILDGFSGTTRVAQALAQRGYQVIANDLAVWSKVFGTCYLLNAQEPRTYQPLMDHLNALPPADGWFTEHYGGAPNGGSAIQPDGLKRPWQRKNTRRLDAIRAEIDRLSLSATERSVALASLMLALDRVDNTLGHFASYLKDWSPRSYNDLVLKVPHLWINQEAHRVHQGDIFDLLPSTEVDLAYFDPPYGSNNEKMPPSRVRYASYYHVWTSVCLADAPALFGRARRRKDSSDRIAGSIFEEFRRSATGRFVAVEAIEKLMACTRATWIIFSYSSGGRATAEQLHEVIQRHGRLDRVVEIRYRKNVMAQMKWTHAWLRAAEQPHREFLFLIEK